ncbi:unnamed protein product (macronuclear) [Paramecium tetraurelia]|uniref:Uncharacterized protein n=1 Tax=Paramecium tetraurelia TaxID=5888 RepID=A0DXR0_PARTE|nr:uncharacterized protein GSPATT00021451001 [Paramecium tetraurelia]CAK87827.1 unnamed protein product [Paramecium tetraurelia]|eukprot:XP_001455224.1 hypothetical protein (macronuclear) [Paramecium tetraurelia strain d4-2]
MLNQMFQSKLTWIASAFNIQKFFSNYTSNYLDNPQYILKLINCECHPIKVYIKSLITNNLFPNIFVNFERVKFISIIQLKKTYVQVLSVSEIKKYKILYFLRRREYDFLIITCMDQNQCISINQGITSEIVIIYNQKSSMEFQFNYFLID